MSKVLISLLIMGAVFIFILGGGSGVLYQKQKDPTQKEILPSEKDQKTESAIKALSSKVVPSIVSYGEVANIEGRNITLNYGGDSLIVRVKDDAQIFSFAQTAPLKKGDIAATTRQKVEFEKIKKGDNLNIIIKLLPDGQLEGQMVTIMPSFNNLTTPPKAVK